MSRAYQLDLRERIVNHAQINQRGDTAETFEVSTRTVRRYLERKRTRGTLQPGKTTGRIRSLTPEQETALGAQCDADPEGTLEAYRQHLNVTHGVLVSRSTISRALVRLNRTRKKTTRAVEQNPVTREAWRVHVQTDSADDLVFLDESSTHLAMTGLYARSLRGTRAFGKVPRNRGANVTLISTLSSAGETHALTLEGGLDRAAFEVYVETVLVPELRAGQTVVMDNLSVHKSPRARELIEARGCSLLFLPTYSPDLNPIEGMFSKLKAFLRRVGARSRAVLDEAIAVGLAMVSGSDAQGWFERCGYHLSGQPL
ncbi:MAG: IS630 family transposase [Pleurocapsa sp. SU_196_0]|nr:IS630 family transposase [Pleurocapsa sp. SU_196_0]